MFCRGTESRLIDCRHNGIGVHNCDHTDDAGVRCLVGEMGNFSPAMNRPPAVVNFNVHFTFRTNSLLHLRRCPTGWRIGSK